MHTKHHSVMTSKCVNIYFIYAKYILSTFQSVITKFSGMQSVILYEKKPGVYCKIRDICAM